MALNRVCFRFLLTVFLVSELCGAASLTLHGEKGGNITLDCGLSTIEDSSVILKYGSITAYGYEQDNQFKGRVHKSGLCDLVLQDLKTTDAGRYRLYIYEREHLMSDISLEIHINDTLTGREGEELVFGDLPRDAESVQHQTDTGWTEVWKRGQGVLSDRLTDNDGHLVIRDFRSSDAGEYRVLNKTGGILITLTVKESGTESKGNLNSTNDHSVDTEHQPVWVWIVALVASVALVVIMVAVFKKIQSDRMKHPTRTKNKDFYQCHKLFRGPDDLTE